jgi:hypothetical protein
MQLLARDWWLMAIILTTQDDLGSKPMPGKIVRETLSQKNPSQKRAGRVTQDEGPEFKPQYHIIMKL